MKMNKIIAGILACSVIGGTMCYNYTIPENANLTASAEEYTEGTYESLTYLKYSDHIEIVACDKTATEVVIPAEIDGLPVTKILSYAFCYCSSLTSITIPDSVASIEYCVFSHCSSLTSITIPDSVTSIGILAFYDCSGLISITIENPDCDIFDSKSTISNGYDESVFYYFNGIIYGYENSTAQAYVKKNGYKFVSLGKASVRLGDVDDDMSINSNDASMILAEYANVSTGHEAAFTEKQKKAADVNADGQIDSSDSSLILSYYAYTSTGGSDSMEDFLNK